MERMHTTSLYQFNSTWGYVQSLNQSTTLTNNEYKLVQVIRVLSFSSTWVHTSLGYTKYQPIQVYFSISHWDQELSITTISKWHSLNKSVQQISQITTSPSEGYYNNQVLNPISPRHYRYDKFTTLCSFSFLLFMFFTYGSTFII